MKPKRIQYSFKMTPEQFIRKVVESYEQSRQPQFYHPSIRRGRSHTIAGLLEDLFAAFLAFNLKEHYGFLVDQPLIVDGETIMPDIILVQDGKVRHMVDVKTDLGWKRKEFTDHCRVDNSRIAKILGKTGSVKDGITKERTALKVMKSARYHIVIMSDQNISRPQFINHMKRVKRLKNIEVYVLSENQRLNVYDKNADEVMEATNISHDEFVRLMGNLTRGR